MKDYDEHLASLPTHIADQAEAAEEESLTIMKEYVWLSNLTGYPKEPGGDSQYRQAMDFIMRHTHQPRLCPHLDKAPNQPGWWFIGLDRDEIKCKECLAAIMADSVALARTMADKRCELCLKPTTFFHADAVRFGLGFDDGVVAVSAFYEACADCHNRTGAPTP